MANSATKIPLFYYSPFLLFLKEKPNFTQIFLAPGYCCATQIRHHASSSDFISSHCFLVSGNLLGLVTGMWGLFLPDSRHTLLSLLDTSEMIISTIHPPREVTILSYHWSDLALPAFHWSFRSSEMLGWKLPLATWQ